jgi:lipopolysaccharide assembly outer membrane protein LptD (OstA)
VIPFEQVARAPQTAMLRRLLGLTCLCWLLFPADIAFAQDVPLTGCKTKKLDVLGTGTTAGRFEKGIGFECDGTRVFAEEIHWDDKTVFAKGNVVVIQDGLRLTADRMEMDRVTRLGTFYVVSGTARLTDKPVQGSQFGTLEPEVSFHAAKLERLGPKSYRMTDGWFSTCVQANPRWDIRGSSGSVILDERVLLRNALLRVKGVPVIYLPFLYYPLGEDDRSTGFLIPTYSTSSLRGHGVSNAFFWALGRSHDATFYHDYFSKTGQGVAAQYRFMTAPGSSGEISVNMMDEKEQRDPNGNLLRTGHRSYDIRGSMNSTLTRRFRFIGRANYFTDRPLPSRSIFLRLRRWKLQQLRPVPGAGGTAGRLHESHDRSAPRPASAGESLGQRAAVQTFASVRFR